MRHHTALVESLHADPAVRPALLALSLRMEAMGFSQHARENVVKYTSVEGTPSGCLYLTAADEAILEDAFITGFEPVPFTDAAWDGPDHDGDVESGNEPLPELPDHRDPHDWLPGEFPAIDPTEPPDSWPGSSHAGWATLPAVAGGSPEAYQYTDQDYEDWLASVDADYPPDDQVEELRAWYDLHPLAEFNAVRTD